MDMTKGNEGSIGLNYPMLTRENYTAWALKMRVFMQAQGVWEAVQSSDPKVVVETKTDKMALAAIYQGIPEEMLLSIAEKKCAKDAWAAIKTMSLGGDRVKKAKVQTLKVDFESLNMKETEKLDDFCMKLYGMVTNIRALGETMEEAYVVKKLLRAVPSRYLQIASTIEQFGNLEEMTVEEIVGRLKAHDERLRGKIEEPSGGQLLLTEEEWKKREANDSQLLLTKEEWMKRTTSGGRDRTGDSRSKENWRGRDKSKVRCYNCNILGHYAGDCRKPRRGKESRAESNLSQVEDDDEPTLLFTETGENKNEVVLLNEQSMVPQLKTGGNNGTESNLWYLDNGASNHMTGVRSKFKELDESITGLVKFGDGSTVNIKGKGTVVFNCKNGEEKSLHEVYYIPTLCNNIISLGQLSETGSRVLLKGEFLWVHDEQGRLLMKVKRSANRLYKIILESFETTCLMSKTEEQAWLWHSRLGHVNFQAIIQMENNGMVNGLPKLKQPKELCTGCLMSKQTRKGFPSKTEFRAKAPLELIHGDLCGPISPPTAAGNRYFLLLVDDHTRVMWVYLQKTKDEALGNFKKFKALVERGSSKIGVFRSDRGGEFLSNEFSNYCEEVGIQRHYTAPYSPQQKGVVERRNRTVVAMARSFLKERKLPLFLWGEAVRHAVYVLNRVSTRSLTNMTPYEAWSGKKTKSQSY